MKPDVIDHQETKLCFLDLIPDRSIVLSAGIGGNITPETFLASQKECLIIGLDPSALAKFFLSRASHIPNFLWLPYALGVSNEPIIFHESVKGEIMGSSDPNHRSITNNESAMTDI